MAPFHRTASATLDVFTFACRTPRHESFRAIPNAPPRIHVAPRQGPIEDRTETLVRFDLNEHDGVPHVRLTHSGFSDRGSRDEHGRGWAMVFGWLRGYTQ